MGDWEKDGAEGRFEGEEEGCHFSGGKGAERKIDERFGGDGAGGKEYQTSVEPGKAIKERATSTCEVAEGERSWHWLTVGFLKDETVRKCIHRSGSEMLNHSITTLNRYSMQNYCTTL